MRRTLILVAALFLAAGISQARQWAVVDLSNCFLRAKPDYESSCESQCLMGTILEVTGEDRYWKKVNAPDYKDVWTTELGLALMDDAQKDEYLAAPKWICTAEYSRIYSGASELSEPIGDLTMGCLLRRAESKLDGWAKVLTASGREGWVKLDDVEKFEEWAATRNASQRNLVATAMRFVGVPYLWGGMSVKGFDCSGLVKFVYFMNGIVLLRNAREQFNSGVEVPYELDKMQPGDLIFYGTPAAAKTPAKVTHVSMYIGDGYIIHSSQLVRVNSIVKGEEDYYEKKEILGVRRMVGSVDKDPAIVSVSKYPWYFVQ